MSNDGQGAEVVSFTTTSRGTLERGGSGFVYHPEAEFWSKGTDFFSYRFDQLPEESAIVFLLADPLSEPTMVIDLELELELPIRLTARQGTLAAQGNVDRLGLGTEAESSFVSAMLRKPVKPAGNKVTTGLNPGQMTLINGEEVTFASIGQLDLVVGFDGTSYSLKARRSSTGETPISTLLQQSPQSVAARWWSSGATADRDRGLILQVGNRVAASLPDAKRFDDPSPTIELRFGALSLGPGASGLLALDGIEAWIEPASSPHLLPIFADGVERAGLDAWAATTGNLAVTGLAAISGNLGIDVAGPFPAYLEAPSVGGLPRYRARFSFDPAQLSWTAGDATTILEGIDEHSSETLFIVELRWWSADDTSSDDGGLRVWLDDGSGGGNQLIGEVSNLANSSQDLGEVRFGAIDPQGTADGPLYLDDLESWH